MKDINVYLSNSLTKQKELFVPIKKGHVSMYVCGPTVYDYVHVGNMRPVVVFDTLRRLFMALGYQVIFVSNYTDVDDRIIDKALHSEKTEVSISEFYIDAFVDSITKLNALLPSFTPKATEHITAMKHFIDVLVKKDAAYVAEGEVFFRVNKIDKYGTLANINQVDLQTGARVDENSKKENPNDFVLWKTTDKGIKWDSPWGEGRPGWHTECVVMIQDIFKASLIDIHAGGFDLKFPHHENEMAQSLAYQNTTLANYWLHNGFINLNNQKMAKSTGNIITAKDFINEYGGAALRLLLLSTHYRAPVNLSADIITNSQNEVRKMKRTLSALKRHLALFPSDKKDKQMLSTFLETLANDLDTPNALSHLYNMVKEGNLALRSKEIDDDLVSKIHYALVQMLDILGLNLEVKDLTKDDVIVLKDYENARKNKEFSKSDTLRDELIKRGVL